VLKLNRISRQLDICLEEVVNDAVIANVEESVNMK
jgi:hypothetical protein